MSAKSWGALGNQQEVKQKLSPQDSLWIHRKIDIEIICDTVW